MEVFATTPSVFLLLTITLIAVLLIKLFAAIYKQLTYWKHNNVPYIESVPIIGPAWRFFLRRISFFEYADHLYNLYPNAKYVGMMDFTLPSLMVRDPELIREITVKSFEHFTDHRSFFDKDVEPLFAKNIFSLQGDQWRAMRTILSPSFTASKMRLMFELISKCSQEFVTYLHDHPEYCSSLDVKEDFTRYTNDVIASVAFGVNVNSMEDRENDFYVKGKKIFSSLFGSMAKMLALRFCPRLLKVLGITMIPRDVTNFFRKVISENVQTRYEKKIVRPDMLHLLMQARDKETSANHQMTVDDIVSQAFIFFLAGFDSTANLMCYMAYELALHSDVQEKLRKEVDRCLEEGNGQISYDSLTKMEYMDTVIAETLRKYPSMIFNDRVCTQKFQLPPAEPGYSAADLYPGDNVWFPVYSLHHDPKYFPDPEKFDPERFSEENKSKIVPYTYIPFGVGPRKCIGDRFALMETKMLMAHLLQRLVVKRTEKTQVPLQFKRDSFAPTPFGGIWLGLEKRTS